MQSYPFYVYIIWSNTHKVYYKGFSEDPKKRLEDHNNGKAEFTSKFTPWELVFMQGFDSKREALIREKRIKKYSHSQIEKLIKSNGLNLLNTDNKFGSSFD
jgi:putative endonuclease